MRNKVFKAIEVNGCYVCVSHEYDTNGYLRIHHCDNEGRFLLHRFLYEETNGKIKDDEIVHHLCGNRTCLNVAHMVKMNREEISIEFVVQTKQPHNNKEGKE